MQSSETKRYLRDCDEQVIEPAMKAGLDSECRYAYLCEVFRALAGDAGVRRKYQAMMDSAYVEVVYNFDVGDGISRQMEYLMRFRLEHQMMQNLLQFIKENDNCDETHGLAIAQLRFMRLQLQRQKSYFETVQYHASSEALSKSDLFSGYADVQTFCERMLVTVRERLWKEQ